MELVTNNGIKQNNIVKHFFVVTQNDIYTIYGGKRQKDNKGFPVSLLCLDC